MASSNAAKTKFKPMLLLILLVPVGLFMLPSTIVLLAALVPTFVARVVDTTPQRYLTLTVGAMNVAGSLWMLHDVWMLGGGFDAVFPTLRDSFGWLAALLGAGAGWVIYGVMGAIAAYFATVQTGIRLRRLQRDQESLVAEWGDPVRVLPKAKAKSED
jgi:hypothetical protein